MAPLLVIPSVMANDKAKMMDELSGDLEFVDHGGGINFPEQIPKSEYAKMMVMDARDAAQYAKEHIAGAVNIEWRQALAKRGDIPKNKPVLIYCSTGTLSVQAGFTEHDGHWCRRA